jgi:hypothetical protein
MNLILEYCAGALRRGTAVYNRSEFALRYAVDQPAIVESLQVRIDASAGIKPRIWFALADTLTMLFSGAAAELSALDAYSNIDLWIRQDELLVPEIDGVGTTRLGEMPVESDRIDLGVVPVFRYSENQSRLRIEFGGVASRHYQTSTCLIVGLEAGGLVSLDITDLTLA